MTTSEFTSTKPAVSAHARLRRPPQLLMRTDWLRLAAVMPGRTLHYATAILVLASLANSATVAPGRQTLARYGVSRDASGDALTRLVKDGLVRADRKRGRAPRITLLDGAGKVLVLRREVAGGG